MSLGCAACGQCCDPVVLTFDAYMAISAEARTEGAVSRDAAFIAAHWRPIGTWTDDGGVLQFDLRCDAFDPVARLCAAHDDRPPACSRYPWYGDDPAVSGRSQDLYRECSYLLDVPPAQRPEGARPLIPLAVLSQRAGRGAGGPRPAVTSR